MMLLRWSSDAARKLYARLGETVQSALLDKAAVTEVDSVRSHTLLAASAVMDARAAVPAEKFEDRTLAAEVTVDAAAAGLSATERDAAAAVEAATRLLQSAVEWQGILPAASELPCSIDDDENHARVQDAIEELRRVASRSDATLEPAEGGGDSEDGD